MREPVLQAATLCPVVLGTFLKPLAVQHDHRLKAVGLALDGVAVERVHLIVDRSVIWFHSLYALVV